MKQATEVRALRALLSGMFSSGLTLEEMREFARLLLADDQFRARAAAVLIAAVDALEFADDHQQATTTTSASSKAERSIAGSEESVIESILAVAKKRGLSGPKLVEVLRAFAPPTWDPNRRARPREMVRSLVRQMSPRDALALLEILKQEQLPTDPFLAGILRKGRES